MARGSSLTVAGAATVSTFTASPCSLLIPEGNHQPKIGRACSQSLSPAAVKASRRKAFGIADGHIAAVHDAFATEWPPEDQLHSKGRREPPIFGHYRKLTRLGVGSNKIVSSNFRDFRQANHGFSGRPLLGKCAPAILFFGDICRGPAQPPSSRNISVELRTAGDNASLPRYFLRPEA